MVDSLTVLCKSTINGLSCILTGLTKALFIIIIIIIYVFGVSDLLTLLAPTLVLVPLNGHYLTRMWVVVPIGAEICYRKIIMSFSYPGPLH